VLREVELLEQMSHQEIKIKTVNMIKETRENIGNTKYKYVVIKKSHKELLGSKGSTAEIKAQ
jgi:hydroxymethylpyrimidine/phosphomethylpyrimidine kinase